MQQSLETSSDASAMAMSELIRLKTKPLSYMVMLKRVSMVLCCGMLRKRHHAWAHDAGHHSGVGGVAG
jgi:hypothetical protein